MVKIISCFDICMNSVHVDDPVSFCLLILTHEKATKGKLKRKFTLLNLTGLT